MRKILICFIAILFISCKSEGSFKCLEVNFENGKKDTLCTKIFYYSITNDDELVISKDNISSSTIIAKKVKYVKEIKDK